MLIITVLSAQLSQFLSSYLAFCGSDVDKYTHVQSRIIQQSEGKCPHMLQCNIVTNPQTQLGYKISEAQLATKRKDAKQMQSLKPFLKQLQQNSAKLVKDYHDYLSNKERKLSGLPYHMIKKFELLQTTLHDTRKILTNHCRQFQLEVAGRDFDKDNQQHFFKKTMKSYDERRLWLKSYILKNEARMQVVQDEVKKNVDYETHRYTQFLHEVDIQRLQHNYNPKIQAQQQLLQKMQRNARLKDKIKQNLKRHRQKMKKQDQSNEAKCQKHKQAKQKQMEIKLKHLLSLLNVIIIKKSIHKVFLSSLLNRVKSQKAMLSQKCQQLKIAIDLQSQNIQDNKLQSSITQGSYINPSSLLQNKLLPSNITKTDYFIYLRDIHRQIQQKIKLYGLQFRYMLFLPQDSYYTRTNSSKKTYKRSQPSKNLLAIQAHSSKTYLRDYLQKERVRIMAQKEQRQRKREQRLEQERQQLQKINQQLQKQFENNKLLEAKQSTEEQQRNRGQQILQILQKSPQKAEENSEETAM